MKRICLLMIFSLLCLTGCQSGYVLEIQTTELATNGPVAIDVNSFGGNVAVIADPTVSGVIITVDQRDVGPNPSRENAELIKWTADVEVGTEGEIVRVVATEMTNSLHSLRADITIRGNIIHNVSVKTERGEVFVYGCSGPLFVQTSEADVRVMTPRAMNDDVTIETRRGDIIYRVRGESSGAIDAIAMNGKVVMNARATESVVLPGSKHDHLIAYLNDGRNPVILRTVDGDVRISVVADPVSGEPIINPEWITW